MMLERICFSVLESSLAASVLYALMMLGEGRLAKYSPRCRSALWFILSARLLVPLPVGLNGRPLVLFAAVLMMLGIYIA